MTEQGNSIILSAGESVLLESRNSYCRLEKGTASIWVETASGQSQSVCFCTISDTDVNRAIPGLMYRESDGRTWHIRVCADDSEVILTRFEVEPSTVLYKKFLKCGNASYQPQLGFEESLVSVCRNKEPEIAEPQLCYRTVTLTSSDRLLTDDPKEAYRLEKGEVFVYIAPLSGGEPVNAKDYCHIRDTDFNRTIPSLVYTDMNHKKWRLMIKPAGKDAVLTVLPDGATTDIQKEFLERRNITTYREEGYERSLTEFYTGMVTVQDVVFIQKAQQFEEVAKKEVVDTLKNVISEGKQFAHTDNPYYQVLQFICDQIHVDLINADELSIRCSKDAGIEEIARISHFICRKIVLDADWYRFDCGAFVGTLDKEVIGCVPGKNGGYRMFRASDNTEVPVTPELAKQISPQAYSIGRTLPLKPLSKKDVINFCKKSIRPRDLVPYIVLAIFAALIGVLLPTLNGMIYDDYIPVGNVNNLTQLCLVMLTFMIGNVSFSIVKNLFGYRITSRLGSELQNAVYHRLFHLPESFFRGYDSADLAGRISSIGSIATQHANTLVLSSITTLFSLFYLIRMFTYSGKLTLLGIAIYAVYVLIMVFFGTSSQKGLLRIAEAESESSAKLYQYLNGVDKIRMAGVEERALLSYMKSYAKQQYEEISLNRILSVQEALATVIKPIFSILLYWYIVQKLKDNSMSIGTFVAFNSAFGAFTGSMDSLVGEMLSLFQQKGNISRFWAVFDAVPEDDDSKEIPGTLSGGISLNKVSFSYEQGGKNVLNDLSIDIKPGEYVGIVGSSGCGKSTLLKLLLGFEVPQRGMVMVDGKDLRSVNKGAYRRQLGVVLQNGKLISGSIYENITITAPDANMARVNEVVEQVGLKDDIAQMPMGLHTMLSENSNTISGGQQQRILIARAICGKPKILIFDEATSALDNMTQATVSSNLDAMNVTRIVVAHRLSTIKNCDRILVLDSGSVVQEGKYEDLMKDRNGLFYKLASRQIAQ